MTAPTRSGIPTTHAGTNFRSRLEARWAAFFDLVGWSWIYEPFDADGYIPDFLIEGKQPFLVEVGPCVSAADFIEKSRKANGLAEELGRDVFVAGVTPVPMVLDERGDGASGNPAAGLLGELMDGRHFDSHETDCLGEDPCPHVEFAWDAGVWGRCFTCSALGVTHTVQSYHLRPCGHHQSGSFGDVVEVEFLEALWRRAGNNTQWKSRP